MPESVNYPTAPTPPSPAPTPQAPSPAALPALPTPPAGYKYSSLPDMTTSSDFINQITSQQVQDYFNQNARKLGNGRFDYTGAGSNFVEKGKGVDILATPNVQDAIRNQLAQNMSTARNHDISQMVPQLIADPNYVPQTISAEDSTTSAVARSNAVRRFYGEATQSSLLNTSSSGSAAVKTLLGQ
jgi:hypothetical protein